MSDDMDDLFGEAGSDEEADQPQQGAGRQEESLEDDMGDDQGPGRRDDDENLFGSDEEEAIAPSERRSGPLTVEAPMLPRHPGDKTHLLKLTNIVG